MTHIDTRSTHPALFEADSRSKISSTSEAAMHVMLVTYELNVLTIQETLDKIKDHNKDIALLREAKLKMRNLSNEMEIDEKREAADDFNPIFTDEEGNILVGETDLPTPITETEKKVAMTVFTVHGGRYQVVSYTEGLDLNLDHIANIYLPINAAGEVTVFNEEYLLNNQVLVLSSAYSGQGNEYYAQHEYLVTKTVITKAYLEGVIDAYDAKISTLSDLNKVLLIKIQMPLGNIQMILNLATTAIQKDFDTAKDIVQKI